MKHMDGIATDGEDDAKGVPSFAIEKVSDFLREIFVFGCQRAPLGVVCQRLDGIQKPVLPPDNGDGGALDKPLVRLLHFRLSRRLNDDLIRHELRGMRYFLRISLST